MYRPTAAISAMASRCCAEAGKLRGAGMFLSSQPVRAASLVSKVVEAFAHRATLAVVFLFHRALGRPIDGTAAWMIANVLQAGRNRTMHEELANRLSACTVSI